MPPPKKSHLGRSSTRSKYYKNKRQDAAYVEAERVKKQQKRELEEIRKKEREAEREYKRARRSEDKGRSKSREHSRRRQVCLQVKKGRKRAKTSNNRHFEGADWVDFVKKSL